MADTPDRKRIHQQIVTLVKPSFDEGLSIHRSVTPRLAADCRKLAAAIKADDTRAIELYRRALKAELVDVGTALQAIDHARAMLDDLTRNDPTFVSDLQEIDKLSLSATKARDELAAQFKAGQSLDALAAKALARSGSAADNAAREKEANIAWAKITSEAKTTARHAEADLKSMVELRERAAKATDAKALAKLKAEAKARDPQSYVSAVTVLQQQFAWFAKTGEKSLGRELQAEVARDKAELLAQSKRVQAIGTTIQKLRTEIAKSEPKTASAVH